jgi:hypothetical protein
MRITSLNVTLSKVLIAIQDKDFVWYPPPMNHHLTHTSKKYCLFHKDKGHDMKDCYVLKKEIKILITKVYFH